MTGDQLRPARLPRSTTVPVNGQKGLARPLRIEREWSTDREAMIAALRVALELPRALPSQDEEAERG